MLAFGCGFAGSLRFDDLLRSRSSFLEMSSMEPYLKLLDIITEG